MAIMRYTTEEMPNLIQTIIGIDNGNNKKPTIITNNINNTDPTYYDYLSCKYKLEHLIDLSQIKQYMSMKKCGYCEISNVYIGDDSDDSDDDNNNIEAKEKKPQLSFTKFYGSEYMLGSATRGILHNKKYNKDAEIINFLYMCDVKIVWTNITETYYEEIVQKNGKKKLMIKHNAKIMFKRSSGEDYEADHWTDIHYHTNLGWGIVVYFRDSSLPNNQQYEKFVPIKSCIIEGREIQPFRILNQDNTPFKLQVTLPIDIPNPMKEYQPYNNYITEITSLFNEMYTSTGWEINGISLK